MYICVTVNEPNYADTANKSVGPTTVTQQQRRHRKAPRPDLSEGCLRPRAHADFLYL